MKPLICVMIVEDHPEYRDGIALALESDPGIRLARSFGTAERALRHLQDRRETPKPDVILLDLNLPGIGGIEALPYFRICLPSAKIIILTQSDREDDVLAAISSGAAGYILKSSPLGQIKDSIETVMAGGAALDAGMARHILKSLEKSPAKPGAKNQLSERELQVLGLLGEGLLKKEISDKLGVSIPTVATHVRHIYEKLNVQNAAAAISKAYRTGILRADEGDE
jgi:two-component system, NarL family, nitrate/nitrite response regulator NarL